MKTEDDTVFKLKYSQQEIDAVFKLKEEALDRAEYLKAEYLKKFEEDGPTSLDLDEGNDIANTAYDEYLSRHCKDIDRFNDINDTLA